MQPIMSNADRVLQRPRDAHLTPVNNIAFDPAGGIVLKRDAPSVLHKRVAQQRGLSLIRHNDGVKQTARHDVPFQMHDRRSTDGHAVIVIVNNVPEKRCVRVGKRQARGLTASHDAVLDSHLLDLLPKDKAVDPEIPENDTVTVKDPDA